MADNRTSVKRDALLDDCDEPTCGHAIGAHVEGAGCSMCRCPFYPSDLLPMTPEQIAEVRRARR